MLEPGEVTDFVALTDAVTTAVKIPGAPDDNTPLNHVLNIAYQWWRGLRFAAAVTPIPTHSLSLAAGP